MKSVMRITCLIGLVALTWNHWVVALVALGLLCFTKVAYSLPRLFAELFAALAATYGFWLLPFIPVKMACVLAGVQALFALYSLVRFVGFIPGAWQEHQRKKRLDALSDRLLAQALAKIPH